MSTRERSFTAPSVGVGANIKAKLIAAVLTGMAMLMASPMWANTITFTLSDCAQAGLPAGCTDSATTVLTYTSGGQTLEATGSGNLYLKRSTLDETGLGITSDINHEINSTGLVTLDLSSLYNAGYTNATVTLTSIQAGEGGDVCQGASETSMGLLNCQELNNPPGPAIQTATFSLTSTTDVLSITADTGNVLIASEVSVNTPEPGSLALLGSGLLVLCAMMSRRSKISA